MDKVKEVIKNLEERKNLLLYTICEDEKTFHPEVIFKIVMELRALISISKILKEE